jgi:arylsulfatase
MQGVSLLPVLHSEKVERGQALYWQWSKGKAVRDGKWKIVANGLDVPWELYDINEDPTETNNLAKMHPEIVERMNNQFISWQ